MEIEKAPLPIARAVNEQRTIIAGSLREEKCAGFVVAGARTEYVVRPTDHRWSVGAVQATRKSGEARPTLKNRRTKWRSCSALATALANAIDYHDATCQTLIDDLTRLYNVRYLYQTLEGEIRRARRYGSAVSVVFMDLTGSSW